MAIKDILLHLDQSPSCGDRIRLSLELASVRDAHVTGIYPALEPQWPVELHSHMAAEVLDQQRQDIREAGQAKVQGFAGEALEANVSAEGLVVPCQEGALAAALARHARCADLLVLGQSDPDDPLSTPSHLVESVIMASGCPTLLVPYIGYRETPGERVMVAWDGGRESARAVTDALPFLSAAESVILLLVDGKSKAANGEEPGSDLARHLARHGCRVEVQSVESGNLSIGDTILSRLADQAVDLLVMGAYGHSRLRELVLGGVTRHILGHMTVPVLMSH
ncbi:MAG: universal stress protein [Pseudomonadota bacterium]